jgi:GTP-binding protein YchF
MRLGIIGLPGSGKTTIFNTLTRGHQPVSIGGGHFEMHTGVVDVPDVRLDRLSALFKPKKTVYAKVTYADIAGLDGSASKDGITGQLLNQLSQMDGFVHVVRCFEDESLPHPAGSVDARRDIATMDSELLLNDLIAVERKLERLEEDRRKGGRDKAHIEWEEVVFQKLNAALSQETPLRDVELTAEEEKLLSGFGLLTRKPMLVVLNLAEGQEAPPVPYRHQHSGVVALQGKLEMEIAQLPPEEAALFLEEYGIEEPGLERVIHASFKMMGLISFFTVGPEEVHAWTVRLGTTAYEAAGEVHSDLQRGFIRAEVIPWGELVALGGLNEARQKGRLRLEGKEYLVQDGEVVYIRFNV